MNTLFLLILFKNITKVPIIKTKLSVHAQESIMKGICFINTSSIPNEFKKPRIKTAPNNAIDKNKIPNRKDSKLIFNKTIIQPIE